VRRACDAARAPHTLDDAWRLAERATTRPPVHAIVHSVCDVKSLDPSYGASTYRSWERLRARRDKNSPGPDPSDGEDSNPPPPDAIRMAFGIHPREAAGVNPAALLPRVAGFVRETRAAAVGVVGLDYAVAGDDVDARTTQMEVLEGMLGIARGDVKSADAEERVPSGAEEERVPSTSSSGAVTTSSSRSWRPSASRPLPVLATSAGGADADADLLAALVRHRDACASAGATRVPAFLIDASPDLALAALAALPDALLAFTGAVTFSKSKRLHETAFDCPMDRVALASECPEKVPAELAGRGARGAPEWSHPATLAFAAARVAAVKGRGITADDVVAAAARNSARAFRDEDEDERTPTRDEI
jgi:Tat protein secretion system quality control protein TatD with DNase activity